MNLMIENGFKLAKERSRRYSTRTNTNAGHADDIALLANTPTQAETLLHSLERTADNADKTEYMYVNQSGDIATPKGSPVKLVDNFTCLGSSVSSTKNDINTRLAKAWTAFDKLSVIWKSNLTDKIKCSFFQAAVVSILLYGRYKEKAWQQLHKNSVSCIEQVLEATPHKTAAVRPPTTHHENYPS